MKHCAKDDKMIDSTKQKSGKRASKIFNRTSVESKLSDLQDIDMTFDTLSGRFNYRVGALILNQGSVLMVKNKNVSYYYSVGGRVKYFESSEQAVIREAYEETGIKFEVDRLGFVYENFYITQNSSRFHGISLYYYLKNPNSWDGLKSIFFDKDINDNDSSHILRWIPLDKISTFNLVPKFFKTELLNPCTHVKHIVDHVKHIVE